MFTYLRLNKYKSKQEFLRLFQISTSTFYNIKRIDGRDTPRIDQVEIKNVLSTSFNNEIYNFIKRFVKPP